MPHWFLCYICAQLHLAVLSLQLFNQSNKLFRFGGTLILKSSLFPSSAFCTGSRGYWGLLCCLCACGRCFCFSLSLSVALGVSVLYSMIGSVYHPGAFSGFKSFGRDCKGHHTVYTKTQYTHSHTQVRSNIHQFDLYTYMPAHL